MDPIATPLLFFILGNLARELIADACKDYLKDKLKSVFGWLEKLGERDKVELAYQDAMEQAYGACLEMLLLNIKSFGYTEEELKQYRSSIEAFIKDNKVAEELLNAVREPGRDDLPSPDVLRERWEEVGEQELPSDTIWNAVAIAYRRQAIKRIILSDELRELLNAQNLQQLKELIERQGGVKVQVRRDRYSQRMRTKFSPVDLANLMPAYADDPGRMVIRDVFVAQDIIENPPPVEIPKDLAERLRKGGRHEAGDDTYEALDEQQVEKLRTAYVSQSPKPVLDVIAAAGNRRLVLTGDPGSGKSTLMRYLLTGIIEPPVDRESNEQLPWTQTFKDAFPLFIELRDFYALQQRNKCDTFLEYIAYMGKVDQWFLDDHAVDGYLEGGPSLVMFDGLDEIFDTGDRARVMQEIAGFALQYPKARIVVTSRSVGYKEQALRNAGFAHFGIQDLDDGKIEVFIQGWFALTFPQQPQQAEQRTERVLGSVRQSKPIRLLAGNPMLLTIMALLAREEELPRERAKFYEKAVEVLCHHWDANRKLELPEDSYLNADDKKHLLRRIAMRMQAGEGGLKGNIIQEDDLEQEIKGYLTDEHWQPNTAEAKKAARRMIRQLRERNYILCLRDPKLYGFVHRTFLEYLTAAEYVRRFDRQPQQMTIEELIDLFGKHYRDDDWREVLRLICGQIDEQFVGRIVEHLATRTDLEQWDGISPLPELTLAVWCLGEVRNPQAIRGAGEQLLTALFYAITKCKGPTPPEEDANAFGHGPLYDFMRQELLPAVKALSGKWPRSSIVADRAVSEVEHMNSTSMQIWAQFVAEVTEDKALIYELGQCPHFLVRRGAVHTIAEKWPDQVTRQYLTSFAIKDPNGYPRTAAIHALGEIWPDDVTQQFLVDRCANDELGWVRREALLALTNSLPNELTRRTLERRTVEDKDYDPRCAALRALAEKWPDETTRKLLEERAVQDEHDSSRSAALYALVENWPDETTRKLLEERAVQDEHDSSRSAAFDALVENWPDEITRKLLDERAGFEGIAASVLGGWHSEFGRIVFTRDLDGIAPYLDPAKPITRDHIESAAEEANIPAEKIDETVQSLSEHLGWDIEKGAAG